ncbi:MAG: nucleotide exchange factor GrpE [Lachnospiraceae bacterium]|nr:nucleotide exchange factor GrpE [Lachnospiraceae bacterium]
MEAEETEETGTAETEAEAPEAAGGEKAEEVQEKPEEEKTSGKPEKEKKKFFGGRNDKTEKALEKAEKSLKDAENKLAEATDRIQRQMAEFDNFRKRTEKEKAASFDMGARSVIEKLLPVVDSFERGLGGLDEEKKAEPFAAGMDLVYKQLKKMLDDLDVKPIEAVGAPFNPDLHNAVMHVEDEDRPESTVVEEFQKGYTYHGTVIRYSMVKVAN